MEEKVSKHVYVSVPLMDNQQLPDSAEILIGGSGLFSLETSPIQEMRFAFGCDKMYWKVQKAGKKRNLSSMRRGFAYSEADGHIYAGSAAWRTLNTLEMDSANGRFERWPHDRQIPEGKSSAGGRGYAD